MPRPRVPRGYSRGNTSVATGVLFPWTDGRERHFADGGYRCAVADERVQRVAAVVSAAASSLRRVVVPRLERAQALLAAAVLAGTARRLPRGAGVKTGAKWTLRLAKCWITFS